MSTTETRWEGAILVEKLTANGERIVLVERDIQELKQDVSILKQDVSVLKQDMKDVKATLQEFKVIFTWLKWIGGVLLMILIALIANAISLYLF